ncbi:MAG: hypothetical protein ACHQ1D_01770 [Nitrososphaerales archaeon]|jgi:hypothetical protein
MTCVFFDKDGEIRGMAPTEHDLQDETLSVAIFDFAEVEPFFTRKKNTFDYTVKKKDEKFILEKKIVVSISYTRTLDNYLTEIENVKPKTTIITITNNKTDKVFIIEFSRAFKLLYNDGTDEDKKVIEDILRSNATTVYITKKHNPYHFLFKIIFLPGELFRQDRLYFNYKGTIENASAYTRRIISGYGYREVS